MSKYEPGTRVLCISHMSEDRSTVYSFGPGVYEGDFVPDEKARGMAQIMHEEKLTNPRIKLDSGDVVYGAECWWGLEVKMTASLAGKTIVSMSIEQARASIGRIDDAN